MSDKRVPMRAKHTLRDLRVRAGLNQATASKRLNISKPTLQKWERDSSDLRISEIDKVTAIYNVPQDYIFFGSNNAFSEKIKNMRGVGK